ncbi:IclR family transcriptional regulator [Microbacterium sp. NPDC091313]
MPASPEETSPEAVGVIDRLTAILDSFDQDGRGLRISELAARSGLPTSTVSRLVAGLVREHYLERDGAAVRLGLRVFELSRLASWPRRIRACAGPVLAGLRQSTGGTVSIAVPDGADAVVVAVIRGRGETATPPTGSRLALEETAAGRAMRSGLRILERAPVPDDGWVSAAPVLDADGTVVAAITVIGDPCDGPLRAAADALGARLSAMR